MYGTIAKARVKAGQWDDLLAAMRTFEARDVKGSIASYVYRLDKDGDEMMMAVIFEDKESYFANADDPATDDWYRAVRACLASDPEWNDGEIVASF